MEPAATVPDAQRLSHGETRKLKPKTNKCPVCPKLFKEAREARSHHERVHLGVTHECMTCKKVYTNMAYLKHHQKQAQISGISCNEPRQNMFCKICSKSHKNSVKQHEKGVRHNKKLKSTQQAASEESKACEAQRRSEKKSLHRLTTLTGTALRVAIMEDDDTEAGSSDSDDWTGYGGGDSD